MMVSACPFGRSSRLNNKSVGKVQWSHRDIDYERKRRRESVGTALRKKVGRSHPSGPNFLRAVLNCYF